MDQDKRNYINNVVFLLLQNIFNFWQIKEQYGVGIADYEREKEVVKNDVEVLKLNYKRYEKEVLKIKIKANVKTGRILSYTVKFM